MYLLKSETLRLIPMQNRIPFSVWLFTACSWLLGWWMAYDGLRQRLFGDYVRIDGRLGPWAALVSQLGVDPQSLGFFFVMLGLTLVASSLGLLLGRPWGLNVGLVASTVSLLYLGFGTPVAFIALISLVLAPTRRYLFPPRAPAG